MIIVDIKPLDRAGQIELGLTKSEVYQRVGKPTESNSEKDCYQLDSVFFSVSYDQKEQVEYIKYSKSDNQEVSIRINSINIF